MTFPAHLGSYWLLLRVVRPDQRILALHKANVVRFGGKRYTSTELDLLRPHMARLLQTGPLPVEAAGEKRPDHAPVRDLDRAYLAHQFSRTVTLELIRILTGAGHEVLATDTFAPTLGSHSRGCTAIS